MSKKKTDEPKRPSKFGWCNDGHHEDCKVEFVSTLGVQQGQVVSCGCDCPPEVHGVKRREVAA